MFPELDSKKQTWWSRIEISFVVASAEAAGGVQTEDLKYLPTHKHSTQPATQTYKILIYNKQATQKQQIIGVSKVV